MSTRARRLRALLLVVLSVAACATSVPATGGPASAGSAPSAASDPNTSGLPTVRLAELPPEAAEVVSLIAADGPFPYRQDGAVFQNREGILPGQPSGYYHEYTVLTPGSDDRGARRIVTGASGETYWTADHYDSFSWIER